MKVMIWLEMHIFRFGIGRRCAYVQVDHSYTVVQELDMFSVYDRGLTNVVEPTSINIKKESRFRFVNALT